MAASTPKLKTFNENEDEIFSRPTLQVEYRANSQQAHYVATRCLDAVDRSLYLYAGHFLQRGMKDADLEAAQKEVLARFDAYSKSVDDEIDRLKEIMRSEGIVKLPSVSYTKPAILVLRVSNPLTRRFLKLVARLDDVSRMVDCAWIAGVLTPEQRRDALFTYRNALRKISVVLRSDASRLSRDLRNDHASNAAGKSKAPVGDRKKTPAAQKKASNRKAAAKARLAKDESKNEQSDPGVLRSAEIKSQPKATTTQATPSTPKSPAKQAQQAATQAAEAV